MIIEVDGAYLEAGDITYISGIYDGDEHEDHPASLNFFIVSKTSPKQQVSIPTNFLEFWGSNYANVSETKAFCLYCQTQDYRNIYNKISSLRNSIAECWNNNKKNIPKFNIE